MNSKNQVLPLSFLSNSSPPHLISVDDTHYWWNDMPEPKAFLMTPNAEHSETTGLLEIVPVISTWIAYLLSDYRVPSFTWTINNSTGETIATLDQYGEVAAGHVWYGYSCGNNIDVSNNNNLTLPRRDWRIENYDTRNNNCDLCGKPNEADGRCLNMKSFWKKEKLHMTTKKDFKTGEIIRQFSTIIPPPEDGRWVAFLIDITYEKPSPSGIFGWEDGMERILPKDLPGQLQFTTEVSILPNSFPFEDCYAENCSGRIV